MDGQLDGRMHVNYLWPLWQRPPARAWTVWRRAFCLSFTNGLSMKVTQKLGPWINFDSTLWEWFLPQNEQWLYQQIGTTWCKYSRKPRSTQSKSFSTTALLVDQVDTSSLSPRLSYFSHGK